MGPWRIDRRGCGVVVLITALLLAVMMPLVINPGLLGAADRAPLPPPPPVGSCVRTGMVVVPCSTAHDAEVAYTWTAGRNPSERLADGSRPDACRAKVAVYVGASASIPPASAGPDGWQWYPVWMAYASKLVAAPRAEGIDGLRWHACLVGPTQIERFTGVVRGTAALGSTRPAPFGICSDPAGYPGNVVSCSRPHTRELIGFMAVTEEMLNQSSPSGPPLDTEQAQQACLEMAGAVTGVADPTYGGRLTIGAQNVWPNWIQTSLGNGKMADLGLPQCYLDSTGDTLLVGTVAGLGAQALPLQSSG